MRSRVFLLSLAVFPPALIAQSASNDADIPAVAAHVAKATELAGSDLTKPLLLCRADSINVVTTALKRAQKNG